MKAEIYATDRFWSEVPLNGAAPVRLSRTEVAAHLHKIETYDSMEEWLTDIPIISPPSSNKYAISKPVRYPESLLDYPSDNNTHRLV